MEGMNTVALVGRLTRDPELKHTSSGMPVANMRLAVDRAGDRDEDGSYKAGFFDVEMWDKTAELAAQYLTKGRQVAVEGRLRLHEWEARDTGDKRSRVEIVANRITFIGNRDDGDGEGQQTVREQPRQDPVETADFGGSDFQGADDDIPF